MCRAFTHLFKTPSAYTRFRACETPNACETPSACKTPRACTAPDPRAPCTAPAPHSCETLRALSSTLRLRLQNTQLLHSALAKRRTPELHVCETPNACAYACKTLNACAPHLRNAERLRDTDHSPGTYYVPTAHTRTQRLYAPAQTTTPNNDKKRGINPLPLRYLCYLRLMVRVNVTGSSFFDVTVTTNVTL